MNQKIIFNIPKSLKDISFFILPKVCHKRFIKSKFNDITCKAGIQGEDERWGKKITGRKARVSFSISLKEFFRKWGGGE
jgi:hypothetical protein